jgi:hypothetical protein
MSDTQVCTVCDFETESFDAADAHEWFYRHLVVYKDAGEGKHE